MTIGVFGSLPFICAEGMVQTFRSFSVEHSTKYAKHEIIGARPIVEWTGHDLPSLSLDIRLDLSLGSAPFVSIALAKRMLQAHTPLPLILGGEYFGTFALESFSENRKFFNAAGACIVAELSLKLLQVDEGLF